jgi:hypothetical protein
VTATGSPAPTFAETGALPTGISFSTAGVLSGTAAASGTFPVTITASNGVSPAATQSFTLTTEALSSGTIVPGSAAAQNTYTPGTAFDSGQPIDVVVPPNSVFSPGTAVHIFECSAPDGVKPSSTNACDANTSYSGGTVFVQSNGSVDVVAHSAFHDSYTVYALPDENIGDTPDGIACGLGSANDCDLYIGEGGGSDTGFSQPHFFSQPFQVHADPTDSGVLSPGDGAFPPDSAPAITSADSTSFSPGVAGAFTVTATGYPTPTITESGTLPAGVTFSGGVLSGTTTATGSFPITLTASNGINPPATQDFTLNVVPSGPPVFTSPSSATFTAYESNSFDLVASGATSYGSTTKSSVFTKAGLTLSDGVLSGTPPKVGTDTFDFTATNSLGTTTQTFTLTVVAPVVTITTTSLPTVTVGQTYTSGDPAFTFAATGGSGAYTWKTKLPKGLVLDASTGAVTGEIPVSAKAPSGTVNVTFSVEDAFKDKASAVTLPLTIDEAPVFTSKTDAKFAATGGTFTVVAVGYPATITYGVTGTLPSGLTFSGGVLSGTPAAGTYAITFTASNGIGSGASQDFTLSVK